MMMMMEPHGGRRASSLGECSAHELCGARALMMACSSSTLLLAGSTANLGLRECVDFVSYIALYR